MRGPKGKEATIPRLADAVMSIVTTTSRLSGKWCPA